MKNKRLIIDARHLYASGIGVYTQSLLEAYAELSFSNNIRLLVQQQHLQKVKDSFPFDVVPFNSSIYSLQEQLTFLRFVKRTDFLHVPHYNAPVLFAGKMVITLHDVCHLALPDLFPSVLQRIYVTRFLPLVLKRAQHIITVSQFSKSEILRFFPTISEHKITAIPLANTSHFQAKSKQESDLVVRKHNLLQDYFLFVGNYKPHKNLHTLLTIYFEAYKQDKNLPDLVFVGKGDRASKYVQDLFAFVDKHEIVHKVHFLSNVSYAELPCIYSQAVAFLFPSLYEGFGLPLLEAMGCETPVVCSDKASIPEVVGNAALCIPVEDTTRWVKTLLELQQANSLREMYIEKGKQRIAAFSWKETAKKHIEIYQHYGGLTC